MQHPFEFVKPEHRKRFFFFFLALTLLVFAILRVVDKPLQTPVSPNGIVSFEFARTPQCAQKMIDVWTGRSVVITGDNCDAITVPAEEPYKYNPVPVLHAAFSLGLDYLFMPLYALAWAFWTLLASQKHAGLVKFFGALLGYGAFVAALFDVLENYALWQILPGASESGFPAIAAFCATVKFMLLILGLFYRVVGILPVKKTVTR